MLPNFFHWTFLPQAGRLSCLVCIACRACASPSRHVHTYLHLVWLFRGPLPHVIKPNIMGSLVWYKSCKLCRVQQKPWSLISDNRDLHVQATALTSAICPLTPSHECREQFHSILDRLSLNSSRLCCNNPSAGQQWSNTSRTMNTQCMPLDSFFSRSYKQKFKFKSNGGRGPFNTFVIIHLPKNQWQMVSQ